MDADQVIKKCQQDMKKALDHTINEFNSLHTGKASPAMIETVQVDVYGSKMRILDVAAITTPDSRTIMIQPWDKGSLQAIEKGIIAANIGLNPSIDGHIIRCPIPEMSRERRQELAKVAATMAEEGRIGIRAARRDAMDSLKKLQKNSEISEDDLRLYEKDVQKETDSSNTFINKALEDKEKELLAV